MRTWTAADGELCVCELEPLVDVSESAVSHRSRTSWTRAGEPPQGRQLAYSDATDLVAALFTAADQ